MKRILVAVACVLFLVPGAWAQPTLDNMVKGELFPAGNTPVTIENGIYPRDYYPNTELLGPDEMRVTALGTGMPNVITGAQKASAWYVELGNGDKFLFDVGSGSMENLAKLRPDWSQVDKVFASHLHSDHVGGFAELYIGGWMNGRYTPLHFYGPSGSEPRLGSKAFVDNQVATWAWDIEGRRTGFPIEGGKVVAHEFDFRTEGPIYDETLEAVRETYDGPLTLATDLMVWNVTDEQVVVREAITTENVAPTGTTAAYRKAKREPPEVAADWISDDINAGKWQAIRRHCLSNKSCNIQADSN